MLHKAFKRRHWRSVGDLLRDITWPIAHRAELRAAMRDGIVPPAFRERLMLAVTQVNACRYCSQFHAQEALKAGLSPAETRALLDGELGEAPAAEVPAILYAQHWAERDGQVDPQARAALLDIYGPQTTQAIEAVLQMIRLGNLAGNTADYWLYRLSLGRFGLLESERQQRIDNRHGRC